jgi:hypothetical protein
MSVTWSVIDDAEFDVEGEAEEEGYILTRARPDLATLLGESKLSEEQKQRLRTLLQTRKDLRVLSQKWQTEEETYEYLSKVMDGDGFAETDTDAAVDDAASDKSSGSDPLNPNILGDINAGGQGPSADQDSRFDMEELVAKTLQLTLSKDEPPPFPFHKKEKKPSRVSQRIVSWLRYHQSFNNETKTNEHQSEVLARLLGPSVSRSKRTDMLSRRFLQIGQEPISKLVKGLDHSENSGNESVPTVILKRAWRLKDTKKSGKSAEPYHVWVDDPLAKALITNVIADVSRRSGRITKDRIERQFVESLSSLHTTGYTRQGLEDYVASQPGNPFDPSKDKWWLIDLTATGSEARSTGSSTRRIAIKVDPGSDWDPTRAGSGLEKIDSDMNLRYDVKQELERQNKPVPDYLKDAEPSQADSNLLAYLGRST